MLLILRRLWEDNEGSVTCEWALLASILVLGAITGAILTRQAPLPELDPPATLTR